MVAEVSHAELAPAPEAVLDALPDPVLVVDAGGIVRYANPAAEQFFDTGAAVLSGTELDEIIAADSPLMALVHRTLEPFAASLWNQRIADVVPAANFTWRTETYFGGLYQKTVAKRRD